MHVQARGAVPGQRPATGPLPTSNLTWEVDRTLSVAVGSCALAVLTRELVWAEDNRPTSNPPWAWLFFAVEEVGEAVDAMVRGRVGRCSHGDGASVPAPTAWRLCCSGVRRGRPERLAFQRCCLSFGHS